MYGLLDKRASALNSRYPADCSDSRGLDAVQKTGKTHRFEQEISELQKRLEIAKSRLYKPLSTRTT